MPNVAAEQQAQLPKDLATLKDDPAFREFFKLQEGFEWNGELSCFWSRRVLKCEGFSGDTVDCLFGEVVGQGE